MVDRNLGVQLAPNVFFHKRIVADHGRIQSFVLQIQIWENGQWNTVIRCDSSHGQAHIDEIDPEGKTFRKTWLGIYPPYDVIYNLKDKEFEQTWQAHVDRWKAQQGDPS